MRLKEEGAATVKASVDKLRVTVDEAVASTKKLDTGTTNIAAAQRAWAAESRNLKSSMASGNMSLADATTRYDAMIAKMAVANAVGQEQKAIVEKNTFAMSGQTSQLRGLREGLVTLASSTMDANSVGLRLGSTLGTMAAGQGLIIGVLAGVAAIGYAYEKLTATTKRLVAEQNEAVAALQRVAEQQRLGVGGELAPQISKGTAALN